MPYPDMTAVADKAAQRRQSVNKIVTYARHKGLDADFHKVNLNYHVWQEWYLGRYPTGYLIRKTGVRRIPNAASH